MKNLASVELDCMVVEEPHVQSEYGIETIYEVLVRYKRTSGVCDDFTLSYSSGFGVDLHEGDFVSVKGSFRSVRYHCRGNEKSKVIMLLYILASELTVLDEEPDEYRNEVVIEDAEVAKKPMLRKSYNNDNSDIADMTLIVDRGFNKVDYIPCAGWNNNARLVSKLDAGEHIGVIGRLRSHYTRSNRLMCEVAAMHIKMSDK